jgi:Cu2+-exporting ATPase
MSVAEAAVAPGALSGRACAHCGLPVPAGLEPAAGAVPFCCSGCATAYALIRESGLDQYYRMAERRRAAVRSSGRSFEEFDHPAFHRLYVRAVPGGLSETDLYLEGVHCGSCVWLVERVPLLVPGMARAELDVRRSLVHVAWDGAHARLSEVARTLDTLGYRPHPFRGIKAEAVRRAEDRAMLARIGVAGAIAVNTMLVSLAIYSGWFSGMESGTLRYLRWICLLLVTPALLWPGRVFFRGAWAALRTRALHMDLPIAIALAAGYLRGAVNTAIDRGPVYFDGVATLIFLLLVGRFLQQRAQRAAHDSAELFHSLSPATARLVDGPAIREVPAEALLPGMVLDVRPSDTLAADGTVIAGRSALDLSLLTGESRPLTAGCGATVYAGTVNVSSPLRVRVERAGEATRLGRLLAEVEAGARRRAPTVSLAERMAGVFVAVVLALAAVTALLWWRHSPSMAIDQAIALLIVTCPCALALATPLAVTVAIGRAARAGILIKGGDALEALARPGRLVLDKTGTVTEGRPTLVAWQGAEDVKPLVLALERHSTHPIAIGFLEAWPETVAEAATRVIHTPGGGIEGEVAGRHVVVGSPSFVAARARHRALPVLEAAAAARTGVACTPLAVAVDGRVVARGAFGDVLRADAPAALAELRARGWRLALLSGDDPAVVADVGERLGFGPGDRRGAASPEGKLRAIEDEAVHGPVVMVGDGVNDAAAIARATVGIGVHGGAEACLAAADVFLARPGLSGLVALTGGAARTLGVIRGNIAFSIVYNVLGAGLAMSGLINPLIAAVLMPLSSLTVVLASWKGRTFDAPAAAAGGATP